MTIVINALIWDEWNKEHIARHGVTPEEVEEVCHRNPQNFESYKKRVIIVGKTKSGKKLTIVLSDEDRNRQPYKIGSYYVITAFQKEVTL